ncbi:hypothetical protein A4S06_05650 [Erysipelotrichaceae bacterium MTC7]|nr:hypothetical protein A4S06_05650 [Erysipelotrichaceae bacterium MTC7]
MEKSKQNNNDQNNWKIDPNRAKFRLSMMTLFLVFLTFSLLQIDSQVHLPSHYIETNVANDYTHQISHLSTYDDNEHVLSVGSEVDFVRSVNRGLASIAQGEATASKYTVIDSEKDGKDGIIKSIFDVAGKPVTYQQDVLFVLDSSSSMNMWSKPEHSAKTIHCLNANHYYRIPAKTFINTSDKDIFFHPSDEFGSVIWENISQEQWRSFMNEYGLEVREVSRGMIELWNPVGNHYKKEEGAYVHLPVDEKMLEKASFATPGVNAHDCTDRLTTAKSSIQALMRRILKAGEGNRIGLIDFAADHLDYTSFTDSYADLIQGLKNTHSDFDGDTDQLFNFVKELVHKQQSENIPLKIILVTDGATDKDASSIGIINEIKAHKDVEIFSTGIHIHNEAFLREFASSQDHFMNTTNEKSFVDYFKGLTTELVAEPNVNLAFNTMPAFSLYCDKEHPITIGDKIYTNIDEVPSSLLEVSADETHYKWNIGAIGLEGRRFSFYTKMDEEVRFANPGSKQYSTTDIARLHYRQLTASLQSVAAGSEVIQPVKQPKEVLVENSFISTEKSIKRVDGLDITYEIRVFNHGNLDLKDVKIRDIIPEGVYHKDGGKPSKRNSFVDFTIRQIKGGNTYTITYVGRVFPTELADSLALKQGQAILLSGQSLDVPIANYQLATSGVKIKGYQAQGQASAATTIVLSHEYVYPEHTRNLFLAEVFGFVTIVLGVILFRIRKVKRIAIEE